MTFKHEKSIGRLFKVKCPSCENRYYWEVIKISKWFTLSLGVIPIPIFPHGWGYKISCSVCGAWMEINEREFNLYRIIAKLNEEFLLKKISLDDFTILIKDKNRIYNDMLNSWIEKINNSKLNCPYCFKRPYKENGILFLGKNCVKCGKMQPLNILYDIYNKYPTSSTVDINKIFKRISYIQFYNMINDLKDIIEEITKWVDEGMKDSGISINCPHCGMIPYNEGGILFIGEKCTKCGGQIHTIIKHRIKNMFPETTNIKN